MFFERLAGKIEGERMLFAGSVSRREAGKERREKIRHFYFALTKTSSTFAVPQETGSFGRCPGQHNQINRKAQAGQYIAEP